MKAFDIILISLDCYTGNYRIIVYLYHRDLTISVILISRKKIDQLGLQRIDRVKIADSREGGKKSASFVIHSYSTFSFTPITEILHFFPLYPLRPGTKTFQRISKVAVSNVPNLNAEFFTISKRVATNLVIKYFFSSRLLWSGRNYRWTRLDDGNRERERNREQEEERENKIENRGKGTRGRKKGG